MATKLETIRIPAIGLDISIKQFYFYANSAVRHNTLSLICLNNIDNCVRISCDLLFFEKK